MELSEIVYWYWLILGVGLIALEMITGTMHLLWLGISAFIVGCIMFFVPSMPFLLQMIIFGVLSVVSVIVYQAYKKSNPDISDQPALNRRGEQYVGRVFNLEEPIVNGVGKIKVDDSIWKVNSDIDMPDDAKVKVIAIEGTVFKVEAV